VVYSGNQVPGYGNLILLRHAEGWTTAYAHNDAVLVKKDDRVRRGQIIAYVGATGSVAEPQSHFEIRKGNKPVDPLEYLAPD
jgi:murein DD-endopeptidase MepM/ murein hydrolase activator NlpD